MPTTPLVPWLIAISIMVVLGAVIFLTGQLVGSLFPMFRSMADQGAIGLELFPLIEDTMILWLPAGLSAAVILWAVVYSVIFEGYRRGRR